MADNVVANAGAGGATFRTDDDGTAHWPYTKLAWGADNTQTIVAAGASAIPIQDGGNAITVDGTVTANLAAGTNNIGDIDVLSIAAGDNNIGNVDIVSFPAEAHSTDFDTGAGTDTTLAFGIAVPAAGGAAVIPGDATAGLKVDLGADNDVTVTGTVTANLAAGTNNIGDVDVLTIAAGDNNIGNVDIVTVPAPLSTTGGGTEAAALRITVASDSTGVLSIDDNGGSLTIDNAALSVTGGGVEATAVRVTIASDSTGVVSVDDNGGALTVDGTVTAAQSTAANLNATVVGTGTFAVQAAQSGTWTVQPGNTANTTPWLVTPNAATSGGLTIFRSIDLDETEEEIKATAGQVYAVWVTNTATTTRWLKFYNATAANVTVGTTTPVITIGIPGNTSDDISGNFGTAGMGIAFSTAITVAATTGVADADTGAPAANDVIVNIFYK